MEVALVLPDAPSRSESGRCAWAPSFGSTLSNWKGIECCNNIFLRHPATEISLQHCMAAGDFRQTGRERRPDQACARDLCNSLCYLPCAQTDLFVTEWMELLFAPPGFHLEAGDVAVCVI